MPQDEIDSLQQAIRDQGYRWSAGRTSLSELPPQEQARRLGLILEPADMERVLQAIAQPSLRLVEFPPAWDWRDVEGADWTTPVRDQGLCGSCVAFGTVAVLETMLKRHHDDATLQPDLSEAHLFFCGCGPCCDSGWWPTYALDYAQSQGVPDEDCFPYQDSNLPCSDACADWQDRAIKATGWQQIADVDSRKVWLAATGPLVGCMAVYQDFFSYIGGIYRHTQGGLAGYHAVCVVGYSEEDQAWVCKNSWGTEWGEGGWFKIGYGECGIDTHFAMYGVEGIAAGPSPAPAPPVAPVSGGCNWLARLRGAGRPRAQGG